MSMLYVKLGDKQGNNKHSNSNLYIYSSGIHCPRHARSCWSLLLVLVSHTTSRQQSWGISQRRYGFETHTLKKKFLFWFNSLLLFFWYMGLHLSVTGMNESTYVIWVVWVFICKDWVIFCLYNGMALIRHIIKMKYVYKNVFQEMYVCHCSFHINCLPNVLKNDSIFIEKEHNDPAWCLVMCYMFWTQRTHDVIITSL